MIVLPLSVLGGLTNKLMVAIGKLLKSDGRLFVRRPDMCQLAYPNIAEGQ